MKAADRPKPDHAAAPESPRLQEALNALRPVFGDRLLTSKAAREQRGAVESWLPPSPPDAVVMARSTEEVSEFMRICHRFTVPVIPFGAGSSIEGQVLAPKGGISLNLSLMDRILAVEPADMDCTVECGLTRQRLNEELRATGLFLPIDVGAHATLGGMAATRASGTMTVRYGTMRDLVLGLTLVLPDGEVIRTGGRARKSSAGYDLTRLFIGSEGTLGVITELTLRLFGQPEASATAMCSFPTLEQACEAVVSALHAGLALSRIELVDALQIHAINRYSGTALKEQPTLWIELAGSDAAVAHDSALLAEVVQDAGAQDFEHAADRDAAARLWRIRHDALYAARALRPGIKGLSTDVCVPLSRLPDCVAEVQAVIARTSILAPLMGHAGDGNFHLVLLFDPDDLTERAEAEEINTALVRIAQEMGGTCTGEHGIGLGKKAHMEAEHGGALDVMRRIKRAIDPTNVMNPGKIFDI